MAVYRLRGESPHLSLGIYGTVVDHKRLDLWPFR